MGVQVSITAGAPEIAAVQTQRKQPRFDLDKGEGVIYRAEEGGGFDGIIGIFARDPHPHGCSSCVPRERGSRQGLKLYFAAITSRLKLQIHDFNRGFVFVIGK